MTIRLAVLVVMLGAAGCDTGDDPRCEAYPADVVCAELPRGEGATAVYFVCETAAGGQDLVGPCGAAPPDGSCAVIGGYYCRTDHDGQPASR